MKFGYTIIYVEDVPATVAFYEEAFGLQRRFVHESELYAEMETGQVALAFAGDDAAEMNGLALRPNRSTDLPAGWEVCLLTEDVAKAYDHALTHGATPVTAPEAKPWGQTVAYVRDLNGCIVEIATPVQKP